MTTKVSSNVRKWAHGYKNVKLSFEDKWQLLLLSMGDHVTDSVDENGARLPTKGGEPYFYDLSKIDSYDATLSAIELKEISSYLAKNNWIHRKSKSPKKAAMTELGFEKAQEINDGIFNHEQSYKLDWAYGADEDINDWLLVHAWFAFERGKPYMEKGMINFREVANQYKRKISDQQLRAAISDLEFKDMIQPDVGPDGRYFWANFNHGGEVAAKLLDKLWETRDRFPASDRFVRLDDNAPNYAAAISSLEKLVAEIAKIRVNDWPEKEGMIATISGALGAIRSKYVNKTNVLAAMSSVVTFIMIKFAEAPIAEIASTAWTAVKSLF